MSVLRLMVVLHSPKSTDRTWDTVNSALYGIIEISVGIACSCFVTLRPLFGRWRWLSGGKKEKPPQAITPGQRPPRPRDPFSVGTDPFSVGTDGTQVITVPDVELGTMCTASCDDSIRVGPRTGGEDGDTVPLALPHPPPAAKCRYGSDDGQDHHQSSATDDSDHPRSPAIQPRDK